MEFIQEFLGCLVVPKGIIASFLTLVPKTDNPQRLKEYRPICLIDCLYKILANIFASILKKVN